MVTRRKKVVIVVLLILLVAGVAAFLLVHDSGPRVVVHGNFSAKDVTQIKSAVRRELWRESFPRFSADTIEELPRRVKTALKVHVIEISTAREGFAKRIPRNKNGDAWARLSGPLEGRVYLVTNGPSGWSCVGPAPDIL